MKAAITLISILILTQSALAKNLVCTGDEILDKGKRQSVSELQVNQPMRDISEGAESNVVVGQKYIVYKGIEINIGADQNTQNGKSEIHIRASANGVSSNAHVKHNDLGMDVVVGDWNQPDSLWITLQCHIEN
jgi:hypothetical protein